MVSCSREKSVSKKKGKPLVTSPPQMNGVASWTQSNCSSERLRAICNACHTSRLLLLPIEEGLCDPAQRRTAGVSLLGDFGLDISSLVILALALSAVDDLLGSQVADALEQATLAELAADTFVDAVLHGVHVLVAGDFGLGQFICERGELVGRGSAKDPRRTTYPSRRSWSCSRRTS